MSPNRSSKMSDIDAAKPSLIAALLERGVAIAVVGRALLRVREMLIGLVELLEAGLGLLVAGMPVGVALHRRLAEGGLQLGVGRGLGDAQSLVKVALGHRQRSPLASFDVVNPHRPRRVRSRRDRPFAPVDSASLEDSRALSAPARRQAPSSRQRRLPSSTAAARLRAAGRGAPPSSVLRPTSSCRRRLPGIRRR